QLPRRESMRRGVRHSFGAFPLLVSVAIGVVIAAGCAPPNSPSGSSDGGVAVAAGATPSVAGPVDVALTDTAGLNGPMTVAAFVDSTPTGDITFKVKNTGTVD